MGTCEADGNVVIYARPKCEHWFIQVPGWWYRRKSERYCCDECGMVTRHYDAVDAMACRPVHRAMSVAVLGWNAQRRRPIG